MKKIRLLFLFAALGALSSCGIFKKDCGCPHFGKVKAHNQVPENIS